METKFVAMATKKGTFVDHKIYDHGWLCVRWEKDFGAPVTMETNLFPWQPKKGHLRINLPLPSSKVGKFWTLLFCLFCCSKPWGGGFEDKCDYFCMVVTVKKRWAHVNIKLFHYYYPVLLHMRVSPREGQLPI